MATALTNATLRSRAERAGRGRPRRSNLEEQAMELLSALGLKPTRAQGGASQGSNAASTDMKALVLRFQRVTERIKALEAARSPQAAALKRAAIAAGNLSTSAN